MDRVDTATWAIVIFPEFAPVQRQAIDKMRAAYDPLAAAIDPHITLVFPFEASLTRNGLLKHMKMAVAPIQQFEIELRGITGQHDEWLFLNIKRGNDQIIALHDRLYTGMLAPYLNPRYTYAPHLTVGRVTQGKSFDAALRQTAGMTDTIHTTVREITAYRIAANGTRAERESVPLPGDFDIRPGKAGGSGRVVM